MALAGDYRVLSLATQDFKHLPAVFNMFFQCVTVDYDIIQVDVTKWPTTSWNTSDITTWHVAGALQSPICINTHAMGFLLVMRWIFSLFTLAMI